MKAIIKNYTFNTGAKTITLTDIATVRLDKLALITDTTTNKILYNFADSTVSTATVATNVITLSTLQGGENNADKLRIDYDVESSDTSAFADAVTPVSSSSLPLPSGAATSAKQDTGNTSLSSIDGKITAVNTGAVVVSSSALPSGAATSAKQDTLLAELQLKADLTETQPVSLASVPSHAVTNAGTFPVQVDGAALTALQLIDDPIATDDTTTHSTGITKVMGIGAVATPTDTSVNANDIGMPAMTTDRRLLVDASGVAVPVTDNGSSLTVDGTVTANLGATDNAVLDAIEADTTTLAGAVAGSEMQVDVVGALPAGNNNIGDVDVASSALPTGAATSAKQDTIIGHVDGVETLIGTTNSTLTTIDGRVDGLETSNSAIQTAAELLDDTVATLGTTTYTEATTKANVIGAVRRDADTTLVNTTNEVAPLQVDANGRLKVEAFSGETLPVSGTVTASAQPGVDIGDVTINNASGASAVNVQDGGNSLTVDYATTGSGTATGALRVELPTNGTGTVGLNAGSNAIGKLAANSGVDIGDVDVTSIATGTNAIGRVGHDITGIGHGVKTVTTAGTDVVLASSTPCKEVTIQAQTDNTSSVAVGATGVDATVATGTGIILEAGDSITLQCDNLADIYIDSLVSGEGVRFTYLT